MLTNDGYYTSTRSNDKRSFKKLEGTRIDSAINSTSYKVLDNKPTPDDGSGIEGEIDGQVPGSSIRSRLDDLFEFGLEDAYTDFFQDWDEMMFINKAKEVALRGTDAELINNTLCETPTKCVDQIDICAEMSKVDNLEFFCSQYSQDVVHYNKPNDPGLSCLCAWTCYISYVEYGDYWTGHYVPPNICLNDYQKMIDDLNYVTPESDTYALNTGVNNMSSTSRNNSSSFSEDLKIEETIDEIIERLDSGINAGDMAMARSNRLVYMFPKAMVYGMNGLGVERSVNESMDVHASTVNNSSNDGINALDFMPWISICLYLSLIL